VSAVNRCLTVDQYKLSSDRRYSTLSSPTNSNFEFVLIYVRSQLASSVVPVFRRCSDRTFALFLLQRLHEGVVRDLQRQELKKQQNLFVLQQQHELEKALRRQQTELAEAKAVATSDAAAGKPPASMLQSLYSVSFGPCDLCLHALLASDPVGATRLTARRPSGRPVTRTRYGGAQPTHLSRLFFADRIGRS